MQTCVDYDPKGWCDYFTFVPIFYPDSYEFKLRDAHGDTGWVDVTKDQYDSYRTGESYP